MGASTAVLMGQRSGRRPTCKRSCARATGRRALTIPNALFTLLAWMPPTLPRWLPAAHKSSKADSPAQLTASAKHSMRGAAGSRAGTHMPPAGPRQAALHSAMRRAALTVDEAQHQCHHAVEEGGGHSYEGHPPGRLQAGHLRGPGAAQAWRHSRGGQCRGAMLESPEPPIIAGPLPWLAGPGAAPSHASALSARHAMRCGGSGRPPPG